MPSCQLPFDCLDIILKYLEEDKATLHSCLLVNHPWCEVSVRILWKDIWNIKYTVNRSDTVFNTLIACLPKKSKELLYKNGIYIPTWKPPLFDYVSFCKVLSIRKIDQTIDHVLETQQLTNTNKDLLWQEMLKMFMNRVSSL